MKFIKMISVIAICGIIFTVSITVLPEYYREPKDISVIPLMSNSWLYHGKKVRARGFLKLEFEGCHLHFDKESYQQGLLNYVWIGVDREQMIKFNSLNMNYVIVEGTFDATIGGRSFRGVGSIQKMTKIDVIKNR